MTKKIACLLIRLYQLAVSPLIGPCCRFTPSCSEYCRLAIEKYGVIKGGYLSLLRLLKCGPWHRGGIDFPEDSEKDSSLS